MCMLAYLVGWGNSCCAFEGYCQEVIHVAWKVSRRPPVSDFLGCRFAGNLRECCVVRDVLGGIGGRLLFVVAFVRGLFLLCFVL